MGISDVPYDPVGIFTTQTREQHRVSHVFHAYGDLTHLSTETDALGHVTTSTYDDNARLSRRTYTDGTFEEFGYDDEGRRTSSTDRAGRATTFTYDANGRQTQTTFPDGSVTGNVYDAAGRVTATTTPARGTTTFTYDLAGRQATETDALGNVRTFTYDDAGQRTKVRDPRNNETTFEYDLNGRQTAVVLPDGHSRQTEYDLLGRTTAEVDETGKRTEFAYDADGRLLTVTDALEQVTTYGYDEQGNRNKRIDAAAHQTLYAYDLVGRELRRTLPDGLFETREYDVNGNQVARTDFAGRRTTFNYDNNSRLTEKHFPTGTPVVFTYSATGRRLSVADARGVTAYGYDNRDRLTSKTDPNGNAVEYAWDTGGRRTGVTAHVGSVTKTTGYGYDDAGRLATVTDPDARAFTMTYDQAGNPDRLARPNGVDTMWTHDVRNRLTNVRTFNRVSDVTVASYVYTLGASGLRTGIAETDGTLRAYAYDGLNRLVGEGVSGGGGPQYQKVFTYDAVSNRTQQTTTGFAAGVVDYSYDNRDRLLTENAASLTWDANGNQVTRSGGDTYAWDFEDHLVRVTKADGTVVDNTYDADGVLMKTVQTPVSGPPSVTDFLVDTAGGLSHIVAEVRGGAIDTLYVRAGDMLLSEIRGSDVRYPEAEGIGSVRSLTDAAGVQTDTWRYTAFGEEVGRTGSDANPYQFAGERNVGSVGLYQNRARWLDVARSRFTSVDPAQGDAESPVTFHHYLYGEADPASKTDPTGEFTGVIDVGISLSISVNLNTVALVGVAAIACAVATAATGTICGRREPETLHRLGTSRESAGRLERKSLEAEEAIGLHGVSATAGRPIGPASSALRKDVEMYFPVFDTPSFGDPLHKTIVLPKPVSTTDATIFNMVFHR